MKRWVVLGILLTGCPEEVPEQAPRLRSVRYVEVRDTSGALRRTFSGQVQARDETQLSFQVSGRLLELTVKMGDRVKEGQILARIDPADFRIALQEAQALLSQLRAESRSAVSEYQRTKRLFENKNASVSDLDNARATRDSAGAAAAAQVQVVRQLQRQLGYATLKARTDGIIRSIDAEENEVLASGQIFGRLQAGEALEVSIDVPEIYINRITRGDEVEIVFTTLKDRRIPGLVSEIGVSGSGKVAYPVRVDLNDPVEGLESGMAADVVFNFEPIDSGRQGFMIPTTAVGEDRQGTFVFIIEQTPEEREQEVGTVRRVGIETGGIETVGIEVLSGVEEGQRVVTAGVARIYDGLRVEVPEVQERYDR